MTRDEKIIFTENVSEEHSEMCSSDERYLQDEGDQKLEPYFSQYALVKNRVKVEVLWLKFLIENVNGSELLDMFSFDRLPDLVSIYTGFSLNSYARISELESNSDYNGDGVEAVKTFIQEELKRMKLDDLISFVNIGCTSEDVNNTSYAKMISSAILEVWIPEAEKLINIMSKMAIKNANIAMLSCIDGQSEPTTIGKEIMVYVDRFKKSLENIKAIKIYAKFNGNGNYGAISTAFPNENWQLLSKRFVEEYLELEFNPITSKAEHYDYVSHISDGIRHFNNLLIDMGQTIKMYKLKGYFKQSYEINLIWLENMKESIKISNGICLILTEVVFSSRIQRDCLGSLLQENLKGAFGYSIQAIEQIEKELRSNNINLDKINSELNNQWTVLEEPITALLCKYGRCTNLKDISKKDIDKIAEEIKLLSEKDKQTLRKLTPSTYIGLAEKIVKNS